MQIYCKRYIVVGHVQGVGYRAALVRQALQLAVKGWVRNLPNGSVEVLACANLEQQQLLLAWLWQGPALAAVSDIEIFDMREQPEFFDFVQR